MVVRFVGVIRMPVCARASRLCPVWCVSRVLEVTQTHIHIHTHTFTPWRVPRGGGLEGRHAHGELEAHGGGGEEYGSFASARTTAAEIAARWCARKVRGEDRERPYRVESWVVGARACLPRARSARSKVGESAPVVSVTRRVTGCVPPPVSFYR